MCGKVLGDKSLLNLLTLNKYNFIDSFEAASAIKAIPENLLEVSLLPFSSFVVESVSYVHLRQTNVMLLARVFEMDWLLQPVRNVLWTNLSLIHVLGLLFRFIIFYMNRLMLPFLLFNLLCFNVNCKQHTEQFISFPNWTLIFTCFDPKNNSFSVYGSDCFSCLGK